MFIAVNADVYLDGPAVCLVAAWIDDQHRALVIATRRLTFTPGAAGQQAAQAAEALPAAAHQVGCGGQPASQAGDPTVR